MRRSSFNPSSASLAVLLMLLGWGAPAHAQSAPNDPYAFDLRLGVFPMAFQAGLSQSAFGSSLRAELDLGRYVTLHASGRLGWLGVTGQTDAVGYAGRGVLSLSLYDRVEDEALEGTLYPSDAPPPGGQRRGTDTDLEVPIGQKLSGPPLQARERGEHASAPMRSVHAARLGFEHARAIQRMRPNAFDGTRRYADNELNMLSLGYGWSTHWSLAPRQAGERAAGFRRFYLDALFTLPGLYSAEPIDPDPRETAGSEELLIGVRLGMEGSFVALVPWAESLGFGYTLEGGALPGEGGFEGYLLIALGLAIDVDTSR
jgi:hypothetical protein